MPTKILVSLVVVALLVIAALLYFGSGDLDLAPKPAESSQAGASAAKLDFDAITKVLQQDMANIPVSLDAPGVKPASAYNIRSRLGDTPPARQEYQVLAQACELIIYADQQHSVYQLNDKQAQQEVFTDLMTSANAQQNATNTRRTAIHARSQTDWESYRQKTALEVKRLLSSLPNAHL